MLRIVSGGRPRLPPVTGTPIEKTDANTRAVFGDYISIYDIQRAFADKAAVPIYYRGPDSNPT
jgi:type I site-specific restriction-modification system R (restriction) subunit